MGNGSPVPDAEETWGPHIIRFMKDIHGISTFII